MKNKSRNHRIRILLSKMSAVVSLFSLLLWSGLFFRFVPTMSRKEILSIVILLSNDLFRIGLSITEHYTDKYLFLRAMPMVIQVMLGKRSVIQKLVRPREQALEAWLKLLQVVYYTNLVLDIIFTLFAGLFMLDSRIVFMAFLEILLV